MVTDSQIRRLKKLSQTESTAEIAATKAGMNPKTARRYLRSGKLPSEMRVDRNWRTREDPFTDVWEPMRERLALNPGLEAKTLFETLQRDHPGRFGDGQLRTLQRRIKIWRLTEGPAREVFFAQRHEPGRLCASDFTHMTEIGVTVGGRSLPHMVYHFVLTYSNWEHATICYSESFESLSDGLQNALWELGGVPAAHRTDSLSSAVNNMNDLEEFTDRYASLLDHYGLKGERTQVGRGNENGDIEQRHHRFKRAVDQGLMLRGNRDFTDLNEYRCFLNALLEQLNAGRRVRMVEEVTALRPLPARRTDAYKRELVRVDSGSLIHVDRSAYSVPSRLIGARVEARLYMEAVEIWYGQRKIETLPRLRGRGKHRIDYRHIIDWLVRKPGAFENYRYREDLFPTSWFRMAYDSLLETGGQTSVRRYLAILELAAREGEARVNNALRVLLDRGEPIDHTAVAHLLLIADHVPPVTDVTVAAVDLTQFDTLFSTPEVLQ
jgi:hypothetical protein